MEKKRPDNVLLSGRFSCSLDDNESSEARGELCSKIYIDNLKNSSTSKNHLFLYIPMIL